MNQLAPLDPDAADQPPAIACLDFKSVRSGSLRGFATIHIPKFRLRLHGVSIHMSHGKRWASLPSRPVLDRAGTVLRGDDGKVVYAPVVEFDSDRIRRFFSDLAVAAVQFYAPDCFADQDGGDQ